jgi:metal-responsive CopG/Arc/MetJ family transcriptional regulator
LSKAKTYAGDGPWKIGILLPDQLAKRVDSYTKRHGVSVSETIRAALVQFFKSGLN